MRALWSAASGMKNIQLSIDNISNNLANVNTTGFKKQRTEFKDLLYEKLRKVENSDNFGHPVGIEVGYGVRISATVRSFTQGNLMQTDNDLDLAISGKGFFTVVNENGEERYTKDGSFKISVDGDVSRLTTSDGYYVQGVDGDIELGEDIKEITIDKNGIITVKREGSETFEELTTLKLVNFINSAGLEALGSNLYKTTSASGEPTISTNGAAGEVTQGYLEASNVQVVEEMINLISAQRAYEINSKAIQTSDQMLELANNLKR